MPGGNNGGMSDLEINQIGGQNYGGMPHAAILGHLDYTERADSPVGESANSYDDYVRSEIVDWQPDAPYLESDQPRRNPAMSRSKLNLLHNGTRGSQPELPRHPEMFYGFTDDDPRGMDNVPRFDQMRSQIGGGRINDLTVNMGNNDEYKLAERPWTGQSISYAMKDVHRQLKSNVKVFSVTREGRPWGSANVRDAVKWNETQGQLRTALSLDGIAVGNLPTGDDTTAIDADGDCARARTAVRRATPWTRSTGEVHMGVQRYGLDAGAGLRSATDAQRAARQAEGGQAWRGDREGAAGRRALDAGMARAAHGGRRAVATDADAQGNTWRRAHEGTAAKRELSLSMARAAHSGRRAVGTDADAQGQAWRASRFVGTLGAGLAPSAHPERAQQRAADMPVLGAAAHLSSMRTAGGLAPRRKNDAGRRLAPADVMRAAAAQTMAPVTGGGLAPGTRHDAGRRVAADRAAGAAAAAGLEAHSYGALLPSAQGRAALAAAHRNEATHGTNYKEPYAEPAVGRSAAARDGWSAAQQTRLGGEDADTFGGDHAAPVQSAGTAHGRKSLRAGRVGEEEAELTDDFRPQI